MRDPVVCLLVRALEGKLGMIEARLDELAPKLLADANPGGDEVRIELTFGG